MSRMLVSASAACRAAMMFVCTFEGYQRVISYRLVEEGGGGGDRYNRGKQMK